MKKERDELRGRFTRFMELAVKHARADYLRLLRTRIETVSLDEFSDVLQVTDKVLADAGSFEFDNLRVEYEFKKLPTSQRLVLTLLFAEDETPQSAAALLGCSVQHIYNQRSLAIKKLRTALMGDGYDAT